MLGILDSPAPLDSHIAPTTKTSRWNHRLTPRPHFLEGKLIHWVDKAKNMWIIVSWLPIKAEWWDAYLALQGFSQNIVNTPNYKNSKIKPFISPIIFLNKKVHNIRIAKLKCSALPGSKLGPSQLNSAVLTTGPQICSKCIHNIKLLECHPADISLQHTFCP